MDSSSSSYPPIQITPEVKQLINDAYITTESFMHLQACKQTFMHALFTPDIIMKMNRQEIYLIQHSMQDFESHNETYTNVLSNWDKMREGTIVMQLEDLVAIKARLFVKLNARIYDEYREYTILQLIWLAEKYGVSKEVINAAKEPLNAFNVFKPSLTLLSSWFSLWTK